jgi:hypothetical protein
MTDSSLRLDLPPARQIAAAGLQQDIEECEKTPS